MGDSINAEELADANLTDIEKQLQIRIRKVGHILDRLFKAAENENGYVLEDKDVRILASWIIDLQNIATASEAKVEALQQHIKENMGGNRLWKPGPI